MAPTERARLRARLYAFMEAQKRIFACENTLYRNCAQGNAGLAETNFEKMLVLRREYELTPPGDASQAISRLRDKAEELNFSSYPGRVEASWFLQGLAKEFGIKRISEDRPLWTAERGAEFVEAIEALSQATVTFGTVQRPYIGGAFNSFGPMGPFNPSESQYIADLPKWKEPRKAIVQKHSEDQWSRIAHEMRLRDSDVRLIEKDLRAGRKRAAAGFRLLSQYFKHDTYPDRRPRFISCWFLQKIIGPNHPADRRKRSSIEGP